MLSNLRKSLINFVNGPKEYPILAGITAGLYPLLNTYDANFNLINSWEQFAFHFGTFVLLPVILFPLVLWLLKKTGLFPKLHKYALAVMNFCVFFGLIVIITQGTKKEFFALVILGAALLGVLLYKHLKKVMVLQFILAITVLFTLLPFLVRYQNYDASWMEQPDSIEKAVFQKKPNVYVIQPDGYANFSVLSKAPYNYDNSDFETYLSEKDFKSYSDFRSNYPNTVTSNSSLLTMKHHYFSNPSKTGKTPSKYRSVITGNNAVLSIFNNNGYDTHLLLETPYLVLNRPKMAFDHCNINYGDIPLLSRGFDLKKDLTADLSQILDEEITRPKFVFIEKIAPAHVQFRQGISEGKESERELYLERLEEANTWLEEIVNLITARDPDALIVIAADHGGFVGYEYGFQSRTRSNDKVLLNSVFSSLLVIKWPASQAPEYDVEFRSSVNLFRILIAYLSEDPVYLEQLQYDGSFLEIYEDAPFGVYKVLDDKGEVVFEEVQ
jgi:uncharacterized Tic20 family protein